MGMIRELSVLLMADIRSVSIAMTLSFILTILVFVFVMPESRRNNLNRFMKFLHDVFSMRYLVVETILRFAYVLLTVFFMVHGFSLLFQDFWTGILEMTVINIVVRVVFEILLMIVNLCRCVMDMDSRIKRAPINRTFSDSNSGEASENDCQEMFQSIKFGSALAEKAEAAIKDMGAGIMESLGDNFIELGDGAASKASKASNAVHSDRNSQASEKTDGTSNSTTGDSQTYAVPEVLNEGGNAGQAGGVPGVPNVGGNAGHSGGVPGVPNVGGNAGQTGGVPGVPNVGGNAGHSGGVPGVPNAGGNAGLKHGFPVEAADEPKMAAPFEGDASSGTAGYRGNCSDELSIDPLSQNSGQHRKKRRRNRRRNESGNYLYGNPDHYGDSDNFRRMDTENMEHIPNRTVLWDSSGDPVKMRSGTVFCHSCGKEVPPGRFCLNCAVRLLEQNVAEE